VGVADGRTQYISLPAETAAASWASGEAGKIHMWEPTVQYPHRGGCRSYWRVHGEKASGPERTEPGPDSEYLVAILLSTAVWIALRLYPLLCYPNRVAEE
jgi:hypothetical protein